MPLANVARIVRLRDVAQQFVRALARVEAARGGDALGARRGS